MVSGFDVRRGSMIILERLIAVFEGLGTRLRKNAGEACMILSASSGLSGASAGWRTLVRPIAMQGSTWTRLFAPLNVEPATLNLFGSRRRMPPFGLFV